MIETKYKIGILAFGSLIDNPGEEIKNIEIKRIDCKTPFKVEFSRISRSRSNAPTLIPIDDDIAKSKRVKAKLIIVDPDIILDDAKSILWRRETHNTSDKSKIYREPKNPTSKNVLIGELDNFCKTEKVIYTKFLIQSEYKYLTPDQLADFAIKSILDEAGWKEKDGIRYLLSAKRSGIVTELSEEYEEKILEKTESETLEEAIEKLDRKRKMYSEK
jgi:hypothetical protein